MLRQFFLATIPIVISAPAMALCPPVCVRDGGVTVEPFDPLDPGGIIPDEVEPKEVREFKDALKQAGDAALNRAAENAGEIAKGFTEAANKAVKDALTTADKAVSDTARTTLKAANDVVDAGKAVYRFAEREVQGSQDVLSNAERRIREGKVADAIWHVGTDRARTTNDNAAQLSQENEWVDAAAQAAAGVYGGPAGAAAYAAWKAYNLSGGNLEVAIRAGVTSYVLSAGYASVDALPTGTVGEVAKKAATKGAVAGVAVAASGGTTEDSLKAFVRSGGAVVVQSGQAYVQKEYVDPAVAEADVYCTNITGEKCAAVETWYREMQANADAIANPDAKPDLKVTADGEWAISWSKPAIDNPQSDVPGVVLTYVGVGSPYLENIRKIASLTGKEFTADELVKKPAIAGPGWIFLGRYVDGEWIMPRSNQMIGSLPEDLPGKTITMSTGVNLRTAPYEGCSYNKTPIVQTFGYGAVMKIAKIVRLEGCDSYIWAEAE